MQSRDEFNTDPTVSDTITNLQKMIAVETESKNLKNRLVTVLESKDYDNLTKMALVVYIIDKQSSTPFVKELKKELESAYNYGIRPTIESELKRLIQNKVISLAQEKEIREEEKRISDQEKKKHSRKTIPFSPPPIHVQANDIVQAMQKEITAYSLHLTEKKLSYTPSTIVGSMRASIFKKNAQQKREQYTKESERLALISNDLNKLEVDLKERKTREPKEHFKKFRDNFYSWKETLRNRIAESSSTKKQGKGHFAIEIEKSILKLEKIIPLPPYKKDNKENKYER